MSDTYVPLPLVTLSRISDGRSLLRLSPVGDSELVLVGTFRCVPVHRVGLVESRFSNTQDVQSWSPRRRVLLYYGVTCATVGPSYHSLLPWPPSHTSPLTHDRHTQEFSFLSWTSGKLPILYLTPSLLVGWEVRGRFSDIRKKSFLGGTVGDRSLVGVDIGDITTLYLNRSPHLHPLRSVLALSYTGSLYRNKKRRRLEGEESVEVTVSTFRERERRRKILC